MHGHSSARIVRILFAVSLALAAIATSGSGAAGPTRPEGPPPWGRGAVGGWGDQVPAADKSGTKDSPLLKRYEGSFIVASERSAFAELVLPTGPLQPIADKRDAKNNRVHEPKTKKALEGTYTRLVYVLPAGRSPLEALRNYQDEIASQGGRVLFECRESDCGGDPQRASTGGGGDMSLSLFLYPESRVKEQYKSAGYCAMVADIDGQRYVSAELPKQDAHVSVLAYTLMAPGQYDNCRALNERTIVVVDLIEAKRREAKMVTVNASEMATSIEGTGRVALYGILFDFNKADVKPESDPTLTEIATLLKQRAAMRLLVVGHTDNVGGYAFNVDLSQRRAAAVVAALVTRFGIVKNRLTPVGVSFASPVASNVTEDGRAKNRRVELVEQP
jgi:OmpA-OmpF porin, OOP family